MSDINPGVQYVNALVQSVDDFVDYTDEFQEELDAQAERRAAIALEDPDSVCAMIMQAGLARLLQEANEGGREIYGAAVPFEQTGSGVTVMAVGGISGGTTASTKVCEELHGIPSCKDNRASCSVSGVTEKPSEATGDLGKGREDVEEKEVEEKEEDKEEMLRMEEIELELEAGRENQGESVQAAGQEETVQVDKTEDKNEDDRERKAEDWMVMKSEGEEKKGGSVQEEQLQDSETKTRDQDGMEFDENCAPHAVVEAGEEEKQAKEKEEMKGPTQEDQKKDGKDVEELDGLETEDGAHVDTEDEREVEEYAVVKDGELTDDEVNDSREEAEKVTSEEQKKPEKQSEVGEDLIDQQVETEEQEAGEVEKEEEAMQDDIERQDGLMKGLPHERIDPVKMDPTELEEKEEEGNGMQEDGEADFKKEQGSRGENLDAEEEKDKATVLKEEISHLEKGGDAVKEGGEKDCTEKGTTVAPREISIITEDDVKTATVTDEMTTSDEPATEEDHTLVVSKGKKDPSMRQCENIADPLAEE
ncbi:high mobility group nucleosome-binding domain-containing protein 5-like isoform X2 [Acanthaster planci]|uniref:High mobility group nucleosome-binding domain-containing protein 5-like isoform X2 n=1 Tax=Acanthaster planci TaxID=133434 RepID=A0A8B7ZV00_ACAPL|nr:high mobility group nucleosome-binding domain-containing protein 5-like isoform X2 [Acanthaster planci]